MPYKDPEKNKECKRKWFLENKSKINELRKSWKKKAYNKDTEEQFKKSHPWYKTYHSIYNRVNGCEGCNPWYKKNGIKNLLSINDLKYLWNRDKAYSMENPCIHRKDNRKNYILSNCEYLEEKVHREIHKRKGV